MAWLLHQYHYFFSGQLEFWAFVTSIAGVWLMTREWLIAWPAGLVSVLLYAWFFVRGALYADATLQIFFFVMLCYGWWHWLHPRAGVPEVPITTTPRREWIGYGILTLGLFAVIFPLNTLLKMWMAGTGFRQIGGAFRHFDWPLIKEKSGPFITFLDSSTTAVSLTAQWMQARKKLENWAVWIVVDIAYVFLYYYKTYNATAILSVLYCVLAVMGHRQWRRSMDAGQNPALPVEPAAV